MIKTVLKIDGMMCGMCQSHVNDIIRRSAEVKKVTSSHAKGESVILSEHEPDVEALKAALAAQGYIVTGAELCREEKRGLFSRR